MELKNEIIYKNVCKKIKNKFIINDVNFEIKKNSFVTIMGPSGSGKTTLLKLMAGLETTDIGQIIINDINILGLKEPKITKFRSQHLGYIFQEYNLIEYLNVGENILLPLKINHQKVDKIKLNYLLNTLGLADKMKSKIATLSGGQQQRVAIARALIGNNEIILGDEPTGALDLKNRDQVINLLKETAKKLNKTLVIVTHDPQVASYADKIIFLLNGAVISESSNMDAKLIADKLLELEQHVTINQKTDLI